MTRTPLYQKAETEMLRRIKTGEWPTGQRLGNEFELADEFGVSQGTMRRALMSLEAQGYLSRKPGRGTIVATERPNRTGTAKPANDTPARNGVLIGPVGAEADFAVHRSRLSSTTAQDGDAALFGGGKVYVLERMWKRGTARASLEELAFPASVVTNPVENGPLELESYLAKQGVAVSHVEDQVTSRVTTMGESVALSCDRHTALLCLTRIAFDSAGAPVARQTLKIADPEVAYRAA